MNIKVKPEFDPAIAALESKFVDLIRKRLGIVIHAHQNYDLFKTIQEACTRFKLTPDNYLQMLITSSDQSEMLDHLIKGVTIGETYFFRDQQQMNLLQNDLLPEIIKRKRANQQYMLRIWSAGCSSGEEIYTIAMLLKELVPDISKWSIKLLATDINTDSLNKGMRSAYTDWSMRSITDYYKNKYFDVHGKSYVLRDEIRDMVNFEYLNLKEDTYPSMFNGTNAQDIIICRNVLIYFDEENCHQLILRMNKCLVEGGYLMLGASDPVNMSGTDFIFHHQKGLLFSRPLEGQEQAIKQSISHDFSFKTESKPNELPLQSHRTHSKPSITKKVIPVLNKQSVAEDMNTQKRLNQATELANLGMLNEAIKLCDDMLKRDPTNKLIYFTYGLILAELDKLKEAEHAFKKTLFLDNQFVAAHFQLGLLLMRNNMHAAGLKCLKNALSIANAKHSEESVSGCQGLTYSKLAVILQNEIKLYQNKD